MAPQTGRLSDLTPETQDLEKVEPNTVWAFAQLRRFRFGFVTVRHANLVGLIRISCPFTHRWNAIRGRVVPHLSLAISRLPGAPKVGTGPRGLDRLRVSAEFFSNPIGDGTHRERWRPRHP